MIDVRRLRVLREVANLGSIAAAATELSYTASAVSQQIATLEREVGVALVERGPRSITLTDAGRALASHADVILARLEIAEMEVREVAGLRGGQLRLATFRTAGETIMAEAMTEFHRRHPQVSLSLLEGEPEDYLPAVRRGELDLVLSFEYDRVPAPDTEATEQVLLLDDPIGVALPAHHPAASAPLVRISDLAEDAWVASTPRSSVHLFTRNICLAAGFDPQVNFETDDYHVAQALVATGVGVAFLPQLSVRTAHPDVVYRPIAPDPPSRRIFAVFRAGGLRSPTTHAMVQLLQTTSAAYAAAPQAVERSAASAGPVP